MAGDSMDVVFLGTPAFAVPTLEAILQSRHRVVGVVTQPDRPRGRGRKSAPPPVRVAAEAHGIDVLSTADVNEPDARAWLEAKRPTVGVVVAFGQFLKKAVREIPAHGLINLHASLLPKFRGAAPIHGAIIAGDPETGVSVMQVERRLDAGPVFAMERVAIGPDETTGELEARLAAVGAPLIVDVLDRIAAGTAVAEPQNDDDATHIGRLTVADRTVDWRERAAAVHDRVRGLTPHPGAIAMFVPADGGDDLPARITGTRVIGAGDAVRDAIDAIDPSTSVGGVAVAEGRLFVRTGESTWIEVTTIVPAGSREMTGEAFLRGKGRGGGRFATP